MVYGYDLKFLNVIQCHLAGGSPGDFTFLLRFCDGVLIITLFQNLEVVFKLFLIQLVCRLHLLQLLLQDLHKFKFRNISVIEFLVNKQSKLFKYFQI